MSYRIPSEEEVVKAIENCLARTPHMRSQRELCEAVSAELACQDQDYRIGAQRIRRIAVRNNLVKLEITYSSTDRPLSDTCPVCGGNLRSIRNRTLYWDTVELMRNCDSCGYSAKGTETRPARYGISRRLR